MAALLRCPVLARHPWLARALASAPPRPHPGRGGDPGPDADPPRHCPFMELEGGRGAGRGGRGPLFVQRAPPEVQEDVVAPPEEGERISPSPPPALPPCPPRCPPPR